MLPIRSRRAGAKTAILRAVYSEPNRWACVEMLERRQLLSGGFASNVPYPVVSHSQAMTVADLRGDGDQDIATATGTGTVGVLLGNSNGTFGAPASISDGLGSNGGAYVSIASVTLNGHADLIVAQGTDQVSILLGNGDGTFQAPVLMTLGNKVTAVTAADINGDGKPDLIVGYQYGGGAAFLGSGGSSFGAAKTFNVGVCAVSSISVAQVYTNSTHPDLLIDDRDDQAYLLAGNGDGTFGAARSIYSYDSDSYFSLADGDLNGDGNVDAVIAGYGGSIITLLGNGSGGFQKVSGAGVPIGVEGVALADINGDGKLDLVSSHLHDYEITVSLGNGDGSFASPALEDSGSMPTAVAVADLNGDNRPDIVVLNVGSNTASVLLSNYTGGIFFGKPNTIAVGNHPTQVLTGEFSDDGYADLVVVNQGSNDIEVFQGNGDGTFLPPQTYPVANGPTSALLADLGNDETDIIVASPSSKTISVLMGNGDGTFAPAIETTLSTSISPGPDAIAAGNVNGDGNDDLAVATLNSNVSILLGNGDGTFMAPEADRISSASLPNADSYAVAFLPADGDYSLAVSDLGGSTGASGRVEVLRNDGEGDLMTPTGYYNVSANPTSLVVQSLFGDGNSDIVISSESGAPAEYLRGNGAGYYAPKALISGDNATSDLAASQLIPYSNYDLILAQPLANQVSILPGNGGGAFYGPITFPAGNGPTSVAAADLNGDGLPDLIVTNPSDNTISILLNFSNGPAMIPLENAHFRRGPQTGNYGEVYSAAAADFNGDGIQDAVTANYDSNQVDVFLGTGDGGFGAPAYYTVVGSPSFVMAADINGDGKPDIVVGSHGDGYGVITVFLNNGDGTFQAAITTDLPDDGISFGPDAVAAADFNGDHNLDLAVADGSYGYVSVLMGNGDGTFKAPDVYQTLYTAGGDDSPSRGYSKGVAVGDFNGDHHPDLAVLDSYYDQVNIFLNNGDGTFGAPAAYAVGSYATSLAVGSLRGNGTQDIVTADPGSESVTVFLGNGDGSFASGVNDYAGSDPRQVVLDDVNGDGKQDIVVLNPGSGEDTLVRPDIPPSAGQLDVLLGNGDGTFQNHSAISLGDGASSIALADFNGDGQPDVAVGQDYGDSLGVYFNTYSFPNAAKSADFTLSSNVPTADETGTVASGELIAGGPADLVVSDFSTNSIEVFLGNGDGTFKPPVSYSVANDPTSVILADLNGDGIEDIVVSSANTKDITVFLGNGDGTFKAPVVTSLANYSISYSPEAIASADFNGDKNADLAVATGMGNSVLILLGNGDGTFSIGGNYTVGEPMDRAYSVTAGDLNGDKKADIVATDATDNEVYVLLGNGDGTFGAPADYSVGSYPTGVALADFNGDNHLDIVTANKNGNSISVLLNNGDGTFGAAHNYFAGQYPFSLVTGDFNGDGHQDVAVVDTAGDYAGSAGQVSVLLGNGDGSFQARRVIAVGDNPYASLTAADVNGDGSLDLLSSNYNSPVSELVNDYSIVVTPVAIHPTSGNAFSGTVATISDRNPLVTAGEINFTIDWGDGTADTSGAATLLDGQFVVNTSHTYENAGTFTLTISVSDSAGGSGFGSESVTVTTGALPAPGGNFVRGQTVAANQPGAVAAGDLNKDGKSDFVLADSSANTIQIFLGNGDGTFSAGAVYSVTDPTSVVIADINNDGDPDIVVGSAGTDTVTVFLGNGDGTFKPAITTVLSNVGFSNGPEAIAVADFNGDRKPDLAIAGGTSDSVSVLFGNGDGTFQSPQTISVGTNGDAAAVAAGDVNGDYHPDIVVVDSVNDDVHVLYNNANGTFSTTQGIIAVGNFPDAVALADLTGDGSLDIVVANKYSANVTVSLNNRHGGFGLGQNFPAGNYPTSVLVADFNGDGNPDIFVTNGRGDSLASMNTAGVLLGNGDGTFAAPTTLIVGNEPVAAAVADFNGDNKPDVVTANPADNDATTLISHYTAPASRSTVSTGKHPDAVAEADLTNDGHLDLIVANKKTGTVQVMLGNGDGTFGPAETYTVAAGPTSIYIADVNGDGKLDIVVASAGSEMLTVLLGNGNGTFQAPIETSIGHPISNGPDAITVAALTVGGNADVLVAGGAYGSVSVLAGNDNGTFQVPTEIGIFTVGGNLADVYALASGDLNGDNLADLVVTDSANNTVDVLLNNGDGTFASPMRYTVGSDPTAIVLTDLNGDNNLDIATANYGSSNVSVLLGNGDGTFQSPVEFTTTDKPFNIAAGDVNGDGKVDLVTADPGSPTNPLNLTSVLLGNGDGTFAAPHLIYVGSGPVSVALGDLNGDGVADIATANIRDNTVSLVLNANAALSNMSLISQSGGTVTIDATPESDTASITYSNGNIIIEIDGTEESFPIGSVTGLNINLEGGDDSLSIGPGVPSCTINGGAGNDSLTTSNSSGDSLDGGSGSDSVVAGGGHDTLFGDTGNDTLMGGGAGSMLMGGMGSDMIATRKQDESVRGGSGSDTIQSGKGGDSLRGGLGDDLFIDFDAGHGDTIDGGQGLNFAQNNPGDSMANIFEVFDPSRPHHPPSAIPAAAAPADSGDSVTATVSAGLLRIIGTAGADSINVTSDGTNITVTADGTAMTPVPISELGGIRVNGEAGNDTIFIDLSVTLPATLVGNGGNDSLAGGGGDNVIIGGNGNDTMVGGAGMNLLVDASRAGFTNTSGGNDLLEGGPGYSIADFSLRMDNLFLSNDGTDDSGDASLGEKVTIDSNIAAIWGGTGNDTIIGTTGGEFLSGGVGKDSIHGGGAGDLLVGGLGNDTVVVAAEPVTLYLRDGLADDYSGVNNPAEDIISLDLGLDSLISS